MNWVRWIKQLLPITPRTNRPNPSTARRGQRRFRPDVEFLEEHAVPAQFIVTNSADTDDNGPAVGGELLSLRKAVRLANQDAVADQIFFSTAVINQPLVLTSNTLTISQPLSITVNDPVAKWCLVPRRTSSRGR